MLKTELKLELSICVVENCRGCVSSLSDEWRQHSKRQHCDLFTVTKLRCQPWLSCSKHGQVSANHWLKGIKTYRLLWFLTRVSANHASSNWALVDKTKHSMLRPDLAWFKRILNTCSEVNQRVKFLKLFFQKFPLLYETGLGELRCWGNL